MKSNPAKSRKGDGENPIQLVRFFHFTAYPSAEQSLIVFKVIIRLLKLKQYKIMVELLEDPLHVVYCSVMEPSVPTNMECDTHVNGLYLFS